LYLIIFNHQGCDSGEKLRRVFNGVEKGVGASVGDTSGRGEDEGT